MKHLHAAIRAQRTVAKFATGVASCHWRSPFSTLPTAERIRRAARRMATTRN
jgi:hypothetical protein